MKKKTSPILKLNKDTVRRLSSRQAESVAAAAWPTESAVAGGCSIGNYTCTCRCV